MRIGSLVKLNSNLYTDIKDRIGVVLRVIECGERYHIWWNDGSEAILSFFDLEVL